MRLGMTGWAFAAIVAGSFSRGFEAMGDAMPYAAQGVSGGRLVFHVLALVFLVTSVVCGWRALRLLMRQNRSEAPSPQALASVFQDAPSDGEFDPDAALSRYLARRETSVASGSEPQRPGGTPSSFGRKGI